MKQLTRDSLERYVQHGIPPGGFLTAVLENNLMEAIGRADAQNQCDIVEICGYVYNDMPHICHGSPEKVRAWINAKLGAPNAKP